MLSARGEEYDKLHGFDLGIDDYVTKPFSPREVIARLGVIVQRHRAAQRAAARGPGENELYRFGGLVADVTARTVEIDGRRVEMTPKEYDLLFYLMRNRNIALSREKLLREVWGYDFFGEDSTVNTHIKVLRQHLGEYERHIVTIRGVGYRFDE
jgi:DNA-binding response OmpR family regulator